MKFKIIVIFIIITFIYSIISANNIPRDYPDFKEIVQSTNNGLRAQAEQYKTWEEIFKETKDMDNYDVQYYKININVDFEEQFIFANITMRFEISEDNVNEIKLDFTDNLTIIGIQQDGDSLIYIHNDDVITIDLNGVYNIGELITLEIDYAGYPQNKLNDGLKFQSHSGTPVVFTMVSPKGARKWWPCKDTPADKPDSLDLWITYPDEYVCAANGLLMEQICNGDSTITDKWHESYPIATYLTSFAITNYDIFSQNYS